MFKNQKCSYSVDDLTKSVRQQTVSEDDSSSWWVHFKEALRWEDSSQFKLKMPLQVVVECYDSVHSGVEGHGLGYVNIRWQVVELWTIQISEHCNMYTGCGELTITARHLSGGHKDLKRNGIVRKQGRGNIQTTEQFPFSKENCETVGVG